jgi:predicted amidophosphoribosyltransferase
LRDGRARFHAGGWECAEGVREWLAEASDAIVSVFFPAGCRICDKLLTQASRVPLCEECLASFEAAPEMACAVCGQAVTGITQNEGEPLSGKLGLPHQAVLLMRTKPRPNKQILSFEERWESVRGAFATRPGSQVDNKRVLLVDDVMTTGATLDACARALLESGAKSVLGLTVARAARNPLPTPQSGILDKVAR